MEMQYCKKTIKQCVDAYNALLQINNVPCSYKTAYAMMQLKKELQEQVEFSAEQEMNIARKYAVKDKTGKIQWIARGKFRLERDKAEDYYREMEEMQGVEVQISPVQAAEPPEHVTMAQLEALDGLLIFEEG